MKRDFNACLSQRPTQWHAAAACLVQHGAYHAGQGLSPPGPFDLGSLASELAQSDGMASLHLLLLATRGEANRWFPFVPDEVAKRALYPAVEELRTIGAQRFLDAAGRTQWSLIPLVPLRNHPELHRAGAAKFERLVYGYDDVVWVPSARAATDYVPTL